MEASLLELIRAAAPKGAVPPGADLGSRSVVLPFAALLDGAVRPAASDGAALHPAAVNPAVADPAAPLSELGMTLPAPEAGAAPIDTDLDAAILAGPAQPTAEPRIVIADPDVALVGFGEAAPAPEPGLDIAPLHPAAVEPDPNSTAAPSELSTTIEISPAEADIFAKLGESSGRPTVAHPSQASGSAVAPSVEIATPESAIQVAVAPAPAPGRRVALPAAETNGPAATAEPRITPAAKPVGPTQATAGQPQRAAPPISSAPVELSPDDAIAADRATSRPNAAQPTPRLEIEGAGVKSAAVDEIPRTLAAPHGLSSLKTNEPAPGLTAPPALAAAPPSGHQVVLPDGQQIVSTLPDGVQTPLSAGAAAGGGTLDAAGRQVVVLPQRTASQAAVGIQRAVADGRERISLKLHPAELGRIDVRIEIAEDGALRAVISAEKTETLDLMQRDARSLERALQSAGLKTDSGSLSFDQGAGGRDARTDAGNGRDEARDRLAESEAGTEFAAETRPGSRHHGLVDLSV